MKNDFLHRADTKKSSKNDFLHRVGIKKHGVISIFSLNLEQIDTKHLPHIIHIVDYQQHIHSLYANDKEKCQKTRDYINFFECIYIYIGTIL